MSGNTLFITYILKPTGSTAGSTAGYSQAIHCNYIRKIDLGITNIDIQEISFNFKSIDDFKFLASNIIEGTGYTANEIYAVMQLVDNTQFDNDEDIKPNSNDWLLFNLTDQVTTTTTGFLTPDNIIDVVYKIPLKDYPLSGSTGTTFTSYNLNYLDYPKSTNPDKSLTFGDATYFFGNVETNIIADIYTTEINISLPQLQFNSSTNNTWNGTETVFISEIGIYDNDNYLVAIGKLNNPVAKNDNIARTIVFALDF